MRHKEPEGFRAGEGMAAGKTAILVAVVLLFTAPALYPTDGGLKFLAGWVRAGVNNPPPSGINRFGYGVGLEAWFFRFIGLEVDAIYAVKGYWVEWDDEAHNIGVISFPVLLKARIFFDRPSTLAFSVFGGGAYSRFLTKMDQDFDQHEFELIAGAALEKRLGKIGLLLEGRYDWGLDYESDEYMPGRFSFKTRTFFLLAGVNLHF